METGDVGAGRWLRGLEVAAAGLVGVILWGYAMMTPAIEWNAARLFPTMLLAAGRSPYFPAMQGPATGWIYGPVMPLLHLPAALAPTITSAMLVSAWINAAVFLLPILLVADYAARQCGLTPERLAVAVAGVGLLLAWRSLNNYLLCIECDQVAIGLALLSCLCLAREQLIGAAALAVLAVWTKQIAIAVPAAHLLYLLAGKRRSAALRYLEWFGGIGVAVSAVFVGAFGLAPLVFNLWIVPAGGHLKDWRTVWLANPWLFVREAGPSAVVAAGCWRLAGGFARWPRVNALAKALLTLALCQVPLGLLGADKLGGGDNSFHADATLYALAVVCAIGLAATRRATIRRRHFTWAATAAAVLGMAVTVTAYPVRLRPDPHLAAARMLATRYPGRIYFPGDPLVTWWTERKAYHLEYGLIDQAVAGYPVSARRYWKYLPADLRLEVHPVGVGDGLAAQVATVKGRFELDDFVILTLARREASLPGPEFSHVAGPNRRARLNLWYRPAQPRSETTGGSKKG